MTDLFLHDHTFLIAAAGCGKTELIAKTIGEHAEKRHLILTHTNAGVQSILGRIKGKGVKRESYLVSTIAAFSLKYVSSYPKSAKYTAGYPQGEGWDAVYDGMLNALNNPHIADIIKNSYDVVYVDEYQDCTQKQHQIVLKIKELLPVKILGDPLQGIFDFTKDPLVSWESDVIPNFKRIEDLVEPWRWNGHNKELGEWILDARGKLIRGEQIEFNKVPCSWYNTALATTRGLPLKLSRDTSFNESILIINKWPWQCHEQARQNAVHYSSMEEMEYGELMDFIRRFDGLDEKGKVLAIFEFSGLCMTQVKTDLKTVQSRIEKENLAIPEKLKFKEVLILAVDAVNQPDSKNYLALLKGIAAIEGAKTFRRDLWFLMRTVLDESVHDPSKNLEQCLEEAIERRRHYGRGSEKRIFSRTLLVKGLEYDHVVINNPQDMCPKNLYVAISRARKGLHVISPTPSYQKAAPNNILL